MPQRRDRYGCHQIHLKVRKKHRRHSPLRQNVKGKGNRNLLRGGTYQHALHGWRVDADGSLFRRSARGPQHVRACEERPQNEDGKRRVSRLQGCLGYDYHPEDKSVTINEEEAETIRYIYRRYLEGMGCTVIAKECTQLGFKTKAGNTTWHDSGIRGILRNEKYCGDILMGKTFTVDPITKRRLRNFSEEDKYYLENHHAAIISKEDFMAAQTILDNRGTPKRIVDGKRQEKLSRQYAFSCMVKCGYCGATFTRRNWHKGKGYDKVVWQCVNNTKGGKKCCERSKAIPEEVLEGAFIDTYNYLSKNKEVCFDKLYESIKSNLKDEDLASLIGKNEKKLSSLELKKKNLVDLKLSDGIDEKPIRMPLMTLLAGSTPSMPIWKCSRLIKKLSIPKWKRSS